MAWRVLILGGGFGGLYAARKLERLLPPAAAHITVVNDVNFMLYTPLLPGAAGGTIEPRHVVVPLREQLRRSHLKLATVTGADPSQRHVTVVGPEGDEETLTYDQLIVTLGSTSRTLPIPGLAELQDFAADVLQMYPRCRLHGVRFMMVEARDRLMPELSPGLADFAGAEL